MNEINGNHNDAAKEWKTKRGIAAHFKCSVRSISNFMRRRVLPFVKIGRFVRFDTRECYKAMEKFKSRSTFDPLD